MASCHRSWLFFGVISLLLMACLAPGCGDPQSAHANPAFASRSKRGGPFLIGLPERYQRPGVDSRFARDRGVFLVTDHGMLVALADTCPNPDHGDGVGVRWDSVSGTFTCPVCQWKFTSDGLPIANAVDHRITPGNTPPRALERCLIRNYGPLYDPGTELQVNPSPGNRDEKGYSTNRFVFEKNEWSKPGGMYLFEDTQQRLEDDHGFTPAKNKKLGPILQ